MLMPLHGLSLTLSTACKGGGDKSSTVLFSHKPLAPVAGYESFHIPRQHKSPVPPCSALSPLES